MSVKKRTIQIIYTNYNLYFTPPPSCSPKIIYKKTWFPPQKINNKNKNKVLKLAASFYWQTYCIWQALWPWYMFQIHKWMIKKILKWNPIFWCSLEQVFQKFFTVNRYVQWSWNLMFKIKRTKSYYFGYFKFPIK